jgi:hypothetical protein
VLLNTTFQTPLVKSGLIGPVTRKFGVKRQLELAE